MRFPASCNGFLPGISMTLLDRYLLKKFLVPFFYAAAGFISVWLVWDLSVNLPDFLSGHAGVGLVLRFYLLQIPSVIVLCVPVALLLALLYTLTQMSRRNEIISMLCAAGRRGTRSTEGGDQDGEKKGDGVSRQPSLQEPRTRSPLVFLPSES